MNARIEEWLASLSRSEGKTRLERIAELVAVNGGLQVMGYGFISGGGPYGRQGLEQEEAFELMEYAGMIGGMHLAFGSHEFDRWILPLLKAEWEKEKKSREIAEREVTGG